MSNLLKLTKSKYDMTEGGSWHLILTTEKLVNDTGVLSSFTLFLVKVAYGRTTFPTKSPNLLSYPIYYGNSICLEDRGSFWEETHDIIKAGTLFCNIYP